MSLLQELFLALFQLKNQKIDGYIFLSAFLVAFNCIIIEN